MMGLRRCPQVHSSVVDMCAFGSVRKRRTVLLFSGVDLKELGEHRCGGRELCDYSLRPHQIWKWGDAVDPHLPWPLVIQAVKALRNAALTCRSGMIEKYFGGAS